MFFSSLYLKIKTVLHFRQTDKSVSFSTNPNANMNWSTFIKTFLGELVKLRKANIRFAFSVYLSVRNNSPPTGRIFTKFSI